MQREGIGMRMTCTRIEKDRQRDYCQKIDQLYEERRGNSRRTNEQGLLFEEKEREFAS